MNINEYQLEIKQELKKEAEEFDYVKYDVKIYHHEKIVKTEPKNHLELIHGNKFQCDMCNEYLPFKESLKDHQIAVHFLISCDLCEYKANGRTSLTIHQRSVHEKIKFVCTECKRQYSTKHTLAWHIKTIHEKQKKYFCIQCKFTSSVKAGLTRHMKFIHEKKKREYHCTNCSKGYYSATALRTHQWELHKQRSYHCKKCEFHTANMRELTNHQEENHQETIGWQRERALRMSNAKYGKNVKQT